MTAAAKPWAERNRVASALRNEHVRAGQRQGVGRSLIAARAFAPGEYVASYQGRTITREGLMGLYVSDRALFEHISEYGVATPSGGHLFVEAGGLDVPGAHLINHSCSPNARWAGYDCGAMLVRAVRPIAEGEEITAFYGWLGVKAAMEKAWHACACGAPFCAGTIELRVEWVAENDREGGPRLPEEEAARRFLADIANDTDDHERLLYSYAKGSAEMTAGAKVLSPIDPTAFLEKLRLCANVAVRAAMRVPEDRRSERRLRQIAATYGIALGGGKGRP